MKNDIIINEITFICLYEEGDCKYKNKENINKCIGCRFARVIKNIIKDKQIKQKVKGEELLEV